MNTKSSGPPNPRQARYRQMPIHWSGCPITIFLITVCVVVALLSQLGSKTQPVAWLYFSDQPQKELLHTLQDTLDAIEQAGGEDTTEYRQAINEYEQATRPITKPFDQIIGGQVWRLVTPAFLHFGAVHLIFNMMWLWTLGSMLETYLRKVKFVLLFVAIAVISNIA